MNNFKENTNLFNQTQTFNNCFQVNINSTKLNQILSKIIQNIDNHEKKIRNMIEVISDVKESGSLEILRLSTEITKQINTIKMTNNQNAHQQRLFVQQIDKQLERKMKDQQIRIQNLNTQIIKLKGDFLKSQQTHHVLQLKIFGISSPKNIQDKLNTSETPIYIQGQKSVLQTIQELSEQIKKLSNLQKQNQLHFSSFAEKIQKANFIKENNNQGDVHNQYSIVRKGKEEQRRLQLASFSAKLQILQKHLRQKSEQPINKIVYPNLQQQKITRKKRTGTYVNHNQGYDQGNSFKSYQGRLSKKLVGIQDSFKGNLINLQKQLQNVKNKCIINEERNGFLVRKIEKSILQNQELRKNIDRLAERKMDDRIIQDLRNRLKTQMKEAQSALFLKLQKQQFFEEKNKIHERINFLSSTILQKANKSQIKKAITFLEDKIKQMIIIIADSKNQEKEGALSKLQIKCLSCDKDIKSNVLTLKSAQRSSFGKHQTNNIRTTTQRIKKRLETNPY